MNLIAVLLLMHISDGSNLYAAISTTSSNTAEQTSPTSSNSNLKKDQLPAPKSADSYESPTAESGDLSAKGEASATGHETPPLNNKKSRMSGRWKSRGNEKRTSTTKVNCDVPQYKELCERTEQMNRSMHERTDRETAEQRGQTKQADRSFE